MPRKPRLLVDGGYYHVIARGNNKLCIFNNENEFRLFLELIRGAKRLYLFKLYHYCIMSNHFHLLLQVEQGCHLPRIMQKLLLSYSRNYRKNHNYTGHLWEGRYKSPLIDKESYLLECGRYIERNPIRAGMVKAIEDYT